MIRGDGTKCVLIVVIGDYIRLTYFHCAPTEVRYTCGEASMQVN